MVEQVGPLLEVGHEHEDPRRGRDERLVVAGHREAVFDGLIDHVDDRVQHHVAAGGSAEGCLEDRGLLGVGDGLSRVAPGRRASGDEFECRIHGGLLWQGRALAPSVALRVAPPGPARYTRTCARSSLALLAPSRRGGRVVECGGLERPSSPLSLVSDSSLRSRNLSFGMSCTVPGRMRASRKVGAPPGPRTRKHRSGAESNQQTVTFVTLEGSRPAWRTSRGASVMHGCVRGSHATTRAYLCSSSVPRRAARPACLRRFRRSGLPTGTHRSIPMHVALG